MRRSSGMNSFRPSCCSRVKSAIHTTLLRTAAARTGMGQAGVVLVVGVDIDWAMDKVCGAFLGDPWVVPWLWVVNRRII